MDINLYTAFQIRNLDSQIRDTFTSKWYYWQHTLEKIYFIFVYGHCHSTMLTVTSLSPLDQKLFNHY